MSSERISVKKVIRRIVPCGDANEIFLAWKNQRNGIERMLFQADYAVIKDTGNAVMITREEDDYINGESFISMIKKDSFRELTLTFPQADLQTRNGLESILDSPKVGLLKNGLNAEWDSGYPNEPKWVEVTVKDKKQDMGDTNEVLLDFQIVIELQPVKTLWA